MQRVLVIDQKKNPLMPCHPARARELLRKGKAAVYRSYPFTIILKERTGGETQPVMLKVDPGSQTTGLALIAEGERGQRVIWAAELHHRGEAVRENLLARRQSRRSRRQRKTRYRQARFLNRRRPVGWLPPSLLSRVNNFSTWTTRLRRVVPLTGLSLERVRFDTQLLDNPDIAGVEYQQGELFGYEVWEYLLVKWQHRCAYCGEQHGRLEKEHLIPKSRGGSDRISNLVVACHACNQQKADQTAAEFGFPHLQAQARQPLKDAAAVNSTRWHIYYLLQETGLPLETGTGGQTKYNRTKQGYPKAHWIDAACIGATGEQVYLSTKHQPLIIHAVGRQSRQMCRMDQYGFPRTSAKQSRVIHGFQTGDLVKAIVPYGKKKGTHIGRVAVRIRGYFNVGGIDGINWKHCQPLHLSDGYTY